MATAKKKPLMRNLGEFFGHIIKGVRTDPGKQSVHKQVINKEVQEQEDENMILRRTTIDEIEFKKGDSSPSSYSPDHNSES